MNRRDFFKLLGISTVSAGLFSGNFSTPNVGRQLKVENKRGDLSFGLESLDGAFPEFQKGDHLAIDGVAGVGKTWLAFTIMKHLIKIENKKVAYLTSLRTKGVYERLLFSMEAGFSLGNRGLFQFTRDEYLKVEEASKVLSSSHYAINTNIMNLGPESFLQEFRTYSQDYDVVIINQVEECEMNSIERAVFNEATNMGVTMISIHQQYRKSVKPDSYFSKELWESADYWLQLYPTSTQKSLREAKLYNLKGQGEIKHSLFSICEETCEFSDVLASFG